MSGWANHIEPIKGTRQRICRMWRRPCQSQARHWLDIPGSGVWHGDRANRGEGGGITVSTGAGMQARCREHEAGGRFNAGADPSRERWLLIRRSRRDPRKLAHFLVFCPAGTTQAELAGAAGLRWTIEECFQRAKDSLGLDHCEARLAPACQLGHGRSHLPREAGRATETQRRRQTEQNESKRRPAVMTGPVPSVPELRRLIAKLLPGPPVSRSFIMRR